MSLILLMAFNLISTPIPAKDFARYRTCMRKSVRLLRSTTPPEELFDKADKNCFWEYQAIFLDMTGAVLARKDRRPSDEPDTRELQSKIAALRGELERSGSGKR